MTATTTITAASPEATTTSATAPSTRPLWKAGALAGVAAAAATTGIVAIAHAIDVPVQTAPGELIPLLAFAQLTLVFTAVGVLIARSAARRAARPRSTFVAVTVALTALSLVPDLVLSTDAASKVVLLTTHLVAAAIVIPALASRLAIRSN